jgi:hypothetical protein
MRVAFLDDSKQARAPHARLGPLLTIAAVIKTTARPGHRGVLPFRHPQCYKERNPSKLRDPPTRG